MASPFTPHAGAASTAALTPARIQTGGSLADLIASETDAGTSSP